MFASITRSRRTSTSSGATRSSIPTSSGPRRGPALPKAPPTTRSERRISARRRSPPDMTWVLNPSLVSETRFGLARGDYFQLPPNFGSGCPEELIGLRRAPRPTKSICGGIPVFNFPGGNLRRIGRTTSVPQFQTPRSYNFRQSLSWNRGAHSLRFGGELLFVETGIRDVSSLLGNFDFSGRFTGVNARWENALADLLLGFPTRYQQDSDTTFNIYQRHVLRLSSGRLEDHAQTYAEPRIAV